MKFTLEDLYTLRELIIEKFYSGEEFIIGHNYTTQLIELGRKLNKAIEEYDNIEKKKKSDKE